MSMNISVKNRTAALLKFLDASPSPFHAIDECRRLLEAAGFERLSESTQWKLQLTGKYFFTRNGSSLVAFAVGGRFEGEKGSVNIIAAHTDSPSLRVKPISRRKPKDGYLQIAVETYGGGLWHTWFDRDLGIAGRVVTANNIDGSLKESLVNVDRPILRIPTLAIHLDRTISSEGFKFNNELQLSPVLGTELWEKSKGLDLEDHHHLHRSLLKTLQMSIKLAEHEEIVGLDLCLYDTQKATLGGIHEEFVQSARLDNLFMSFTALSSLIDGIDSIEKDRNIRFLSLFDNEEVGSLSSSGAESTLVYAAIQRILSSFNVEENCQAMLARSFLISADMAHAVHPNYS